MERWSIKYFDTTDNMWHRNYYYTIRSFTTALEKVEADKTKTKVFDNYEKFPEKITNKEEVWAKC